MASLLRTARRARPLARARALARPASIAPQRHHASTAASAAATNNVASPLFPDEPAAPIVRTEIPGPKSKEAIALLSSVFDTRSLNMMAHYGQSYGN